MDWQQDVVKQRVRELEAENAQLKGYLSDIKALLSGVQERLALAEHVTAATQRRELQQEGLEQLLVENEYEKLRPELREEHVYTGLLRTLPGSIVLSLLLYSRYLRSTVILV